MQYLRKAMMFIVVAGLAVSFTGCPLLNSFTIQIDNLGNNIAVTVVRLVNFEADENVTDNILPVDVGPGVTRRVVVTMDDAGDANALKIRVESTNPQQPLSFTVTRVVEGGLAAGKTVYVTVEGSPTQSVSVQVDAEDEA
ncbi:MAG TPA: hypothetical protein PLJ47_08340 [Candidatus Hydrogenedentes bacterium]|nr:hypothetical protein [Candidatus Hydrogenedentota bacterium]